MPEPTPPKSEIILYRSEDGMVKVDVVLNGDTVWLTQRQMAELFDKTVPTINEHIQNTYEEGELQRAGTVAKFATVQTEGGREITREVEFYNLDVIISVGYRVKSRRGTQFRIWATRTLREFILKGFALDDERLKKGSPYFDELLGRIRSIRASERLFYQRVLDIFATSQDYDRKTAEAEHFFAMVQNKMHWAAHGHTAAELIAERANAGKPNMGLTSWKGPKPRRDDVGVAKNYLAKDELEILERLVSQFLDFAELQALTKRAMRMTDWTRKLDAFLTVNDRDLLPGLGKVSAQLAQELAAREWQKFRQKQLAPGAEAMPVDKDFEEQVRRLKKAERIEPPKDEGKKP
ncbi:MAG: virulence RhuM family protein [Opitutaceae bacterium]|nr:virulence RhuM family protein [Opitutaceae bacterium]